MCANNLFLLLITCLITKSTSTNSNAEESTIVTAEVKPADDMETKLRSMFSSSITYWDIDKLDSLYPKQKEYMKENIMNSLVQITERSKQCDCPSRFETFVCASNGKLYSNTCNFHCRFMDTEKISITPVMIFDLTLYEKAWVQCKLWYIRNS